MTTLQGSLLLNLSLSPTPSSKVKRFQFSRCASFTYSPLSLPNSCLSAPQSSRNFGFGPRTSLVYCTLHPDNANANLNQESDLVDSHLSSEVKDSSLKEFSGENSSVSNVGKPETDEFGGEKLEFEVKSKFGKVGLEKGDEKSEKEVEAEGKSGNLVGQKSGTGIPLVVFLMGLWATAKGRFEKVLASNWFSWWPFWRQEKRLELLIAEADANPKDPVKQSALLAELNKHSPESVIKRFEQRDHSVDSKGVAEYLRALVVTDAIAEYLPDEESGKPSSLPSLLPTGPMYSGSI